MFKLLLCVPKYVSWNNLKIIWHVFVNFHTDFEITQKVPTTSTSNDRN